MHRRATSYLKVLLLAAMLLLLGSASADTTSDVGQRAHAWSPTAKIATTKTQEVTRATPPPLPLP
jgi:hypothetical protein